VKGSRDLLLKFWTASISRERLELDTSNLACIFTTRVTNEKECKIRSKAVGKVSRDLLLKLWDPLQSGTVEARKFKCGTLKQNANNRDDQ